MQFTPSTNIVWWTIIVTVGCTDGKFRDVGGYFVYIC